MSRQSLINAGPVGSVEKMYSNKVRKIWLLSPRDAKSPRLVWAMSSLSIQSDAMPLLKQNTACLQHDNGSRSFSFLFNWKQVFLWRWTRPFFLSICEHIFPCSLDSFFLSLHKQKMSKLVKIYKSKILFHNWMVSRIRCYLDVKLENRKCWISTSSRVLLKGKQYDDSSTLK